jgi:hypothetical protein
LSIAVTLNVLKGTTRLVRPEQPSNIKAILATLDVFHPVRSRAVRLEQPLNIERKVVTFSVFTLLTPVIVVSAERL